MSEITGKICKKHSSLDMAFRGEDWVCIACENESLPLVPGELAVRNYIFGVGVSYDGPEIKD